MIGLRIQIVLEDKVMDEIEITDIGKRKTQIKTTRYNYKTM